MSDCNLYRREIAEAAGGGAGRAAALAHAKACRACGEELRAHESLRALVRGLGKVEAPADFEFRLRARMSGAEPSTGRRARLGGLRLVYAFAPVAAAACFLAATVALYTRQAARPRAEGAPQAAATSPSRGAQPPVAPALGVVEAPETVTAKAAEPRAASAAGGVTSSQPRRFEHRPRPAGRTPRESVAKSEPREGAGQNTIIASIGSAPVIKGQNVTIALRAPAETLRMVLRDERGAGRVVPMRSVSFGSQELINRQNGRRRGAATVDEGVW